jgi:hypothetical protein
VTNNRRRKKTISCLEDNDRIIEDNEEMLEHAKGFYKALFGKEPRKHIGLDPEFKEEDLKVKLEENEVLEDEFSEKEITKSIDESYAEGAVGSDGFSFYVLSELLECHKN